MLTGMTMQRRQWAAAMPLTLVLGPKSNVGYEDRDVVLLTGISPSPSRTSNTKQYQVIISKTEK
jgi:hypothetical protein